MLRKLLSYYRKIQYLVYKRSEHGVMSPGTEVLLEPYKYEENHGDVVHPCVRFIPDGFEGYKWWMVYTPYYEANAMIENPILCYSEEMDENKAPIEWKVYCIVNEKPQDGYNSDPTLLYDNGQLFVYWRENIVENYKSKNLISVEDRLWYL